MLRKISRLFVIKTRFEAFLIIYALALGATSRSANYLTQYPGWGGKLRTSRGTSRKRAGGLQAADTT